MAEEQPFASQPTVSPVVMASGPSCTPTPPYQDELAASNDIPRVQEYSFHSQFQRDISPAQADLSYTNPYSLHYPSVDCIQECRDTPVPDGILQRQVLPRPKPKPWLSKKNIPPWPDVPKLQNDVPPWPHIPRPQPKPRLSLKWTSEVHANHYSHAQPLVSSGRAYEPSLLSSKGLSLPVSHDENAYHIVPCNPYLVPPTPSKDKLSPSTKKLYGCDLVPPDLTASHLW